MTDDGITDIEKAWLMGIDALLMHGSPQGHAVTAGRLVDLWGAGGTDFQRELARRADVWQKRHGQMAMMVGDRSGPCQRLMQLVGNPETVNLKSPPPPAPRRPRPKRGPVVRPSRATRYPAKKMTEEEVQKFLDLIETEGISSVFDPGVGVMPDDVLFRPPLITIDGAGVFYDQIAPAYDRGEIERPWSPHDMEPRIALAFDYALLIIAKERKWTWVISDRYLRRLPWGHPCKMTPQGRPGWPLLTDMLEHAGYIERRSGQTWRAVRAAGPVLKAITVTWQARSSRSTS
jgi:hypothetical protein